jgi:hypothetical protein
MVARLAREAGAVAIARDAEALGERVRDRLFYLACVGQFKRGKSTLLNALVGRTVLPTGVVPVTSAVTIVRHGHSVALRVRLGERDWEDCDPATLATYVSEEHNPGNEKDVRAVEVFVPSPLLASGMCFVDTPGIGSVDLASTAATRAFVPHIDAALVVLGGDPPISAEELALVEAIGQEVGELIFVLNKADRLPDADRIEAIRFTERVLGERLGRAIGPVFQVSALERLAGIGPARDWDLVVERLTSLASGAGAGLVRAAEARGVATLTARLLADLDEQRAALLRPVAESEARAGSLRRAVDEAEGALADLGHRLAAVEERLARAFAEERDRFFASAVSGAVSDLTRALERDPAAGGTLRERAVDHANVAARQWLERWRLEQEPRVEALYREAMERFVALADECRTRLASVPGLERVPPLDVDPGLSARSRLHYTEMLTIAPGSTAAVLLDAVRSPKARRRAVAREASAYLERLLEVNSARVKNDFLDRVAESRCRLELDLRARLREIATSADRALDRARRAHAEGAEAIARRLGALEHLRRDVETFRREATPPPAGSQSGRP